MKLLKDKITTLDFVFVPIFGEEKKLLQQHYEFLEYCYSKVREAQDVLEKLGESAIVGSTYTEEQLVKSLKSLKESLLADDEEQIKEKINKAKQLFQEHLKWILENNSALSVYFLRKDIEKCILNYKDLLALACLLSLTRSSDREEIAKFELVFSELYKKVSSDQIEQLFSYVVPMPDTTELSEESKQKLFRLSEIAREVSTMESFSELMLRNYLETARILKRDLAKDFWHKEVIFIITALDLEFQKCFQYFVREKNAVLQMCEELLKKEYCTIDEVKDNIVLNLRAAKDFIEKIERIFSEDYETHKNEIHQAAQIFDIIHKASQMKANDIQPNKLQGAPVEKQQKTNSINLETKLKPIVETHKNIGIVELEEQLTNRLEEITSTLRKTPHINIVNLKYSQLFLNQNDIAILLSQGNMVESALQVKSYSYIRKMLAFLAELQETLALFSQKHFNSITCQQTVGYILKQAQEIVKEAEFINQQVQNQTNISSSINLISVKNRLMQQAQKVYESLNSFSYMNAQATSLANANIATLQAV